MSRTARSVALDALVHGGDAAEHLDRELRSAELDPRDRAFATELAYGTLKMRRSLEWAVTQHLARPWADIEPRLRWILLLGAYQLLYLDRVPAYSAVDESVQLARLHGHKGTAGLANAVLRKVAGSRTTPPRPTAGSGAAGLGTYASMPDWIAAHLIDRFGFEDAMRIAEGLNAAPRRALRANAEGQIDDSLRAKLAAAGALSGAGRYGIPECIVLDSSGEIQAARESVAGGTAVWQSEESQLAVHLLDPRPNETILDVCAGRGVKTMMIARRLAGSGALWALDDDAGKLHELRTVSEAAGHRNVFTIAHDARQRYPDVVPTGVDAALVDAPCSGLGVIGRQADARWRKGESDPERFSAVQRAVLAQASAHVRSGGRLLYVTCSTHRAENELVVESFLEAHPNWKSAPLPLAETTYVRKIGDYALTVPGIGGADGFFYALLTRM